MMRRSEGVLGLQVGFLGEGSSAGVEPGGEGRYGRVQDRIRI